MSAADPSLDWRDAVAELRMADQARLVAALPPALLARWAREFPLWAHAGQVSPDGDWRTWVIMGGRGFGKTRAGAEFILEQVRASGVGNEGRASGLRIALVAATIDDARSVMVEGSSGLTTLAPELVARWSPGERLLRFVGGAEARLYSGRSPQGLRGPEHDFAWCDELGKWARAGETWDMLQLGLRRGPRPRCVVTTTPSPEPALARVLAAAGTVRTGGATGANPHLAPGFADTVAAAYAGTRLARQEIDGELLADREGSLWPLALIERSRAVAPVAGAGVADAALAGEPAWARVVVGVDPPASAGGTCGIVVAALDGAGVAWVLADLSVGGCSPEGWAAAVARAVQAWGADRVVAEVNQGGDMVKSVLLAAGHALPLKSVHATRGKERRAEPVAALFECGKARFAGMFADLEAELAGFVARGWQGAGSPDRADAMVWALWELCLEGRGAPSIRVA